MRHRRIPGAFSLLELLLVIAISTILMGMLLAAVQKARGAAARLHCQNVAKQLGLALHGHHDTRNVFPPGHRPAADPDGMPYSGWCLSVLPFLEQPGLSAQAQVDYRASSNPFNPPHANLRAVVRGFICPADPRLGTPQTSLRTKTVAAFTSYLGVAGLDAITARDGVLYQQSSTRLDDITDGTSQTLLLGERPPSADFQFGWWYAGAGQQLTGSADAVLGVGEPNLQPITSGSPCGPGRYSFRATDGFQDPCGMFHFWSPHPGGANFVFADGSVRFLSYSANPIMAALASRAGGETPNID